MKKTMIFFSWILAACPIAILGQTHYLDNLILENRKVEKVGHNVQINVNIRLDNMKLNSQQSLRLVPVLISTDGIQQIELKPILIEGKVRNKVTERRLALGYVTNEDIERIKRQNGKPQTVNYSTEVPFRHWMVNGQLELRGYVTGCAECTKGDEVLTTGDILPYQDPVFVLSPFIQPQEEEVKRRSEVQTARLQYRQDSYSVLPQYKDNRAELDKVQTSIDAVKENKDLTITGIYVTGYASPEAPVAYNMELSKRRAQTFTQYVQNQNPELDKTLWHVDWKGEDWIGLRIEIEKYPNLLKQQEVLQIIDECEGDQDACEEKIKALMPPEIYQRLLNEMYGPLRRNEYRIEYNVRHFDLEEGRNLIKTRPDLLSVAEMQKVAESYGHNSDNYREVLHTAVRTYPDNVTARNNAALTEIETEHYDEAITLLEGTKEPSLQNLLGVAYFKKGQYGKSKFAFQRALDGGFASAADNLKMVQETENLLEE